MVTLAVVLAASFVAPVVTAAPAHAFFGITHVTNVFDIPDKNTDPSTYYKQMQIPIGQGSGCDHLPGILREGHYHTIADIGSGNVYIHIEMTTHYKVPVATAMAAYKEIYGQPMPCNQANLYDSLGRGDFTGMGDDVLGSGYFTALRGVVCGTGSPKASSRFCQLADRPLNGQQMPAQLLINTYRCVNKYYAVDPAPSYKIHDARAYGYAQWPNLDVFVGVDTSHGTHDIYLNDIDQRLGVQPTESDGTTNTTKPLVPYGKVQTYWDSDLWVRFYDAVARGLKYNPVTTPIAAYNAVDNAIANNRNVVFTDPLFNVTQSWNVQWYKNAIYNGICQASPWVSAAVGDVSRSDYAAPWTFGPNGYVNGGGVPATAPTTELVLGSCDVGFMNIYNKSADGVLSFLQDFVRHENSGVLPDELKLSNGGGAIPLIIASAWANQGSMVIRDPFNGCAPKLDLGIGRQNHGVNLAENFDGLL
jgi:hypothetical protein